MRGELQLQSGLPQGSAPGASWAGEATPVWGSPSQQNCSVHNWGQGRGLERLSQNIQALFLPCGGSFILSGEGMPGGMPE